MTAEVGGPGSIGDDRSWLLGCEGMRVDGPDGPLGVVVAPIYEPSARWDRPLGLVVQGPLGEVRVPIESVGSVDRADRRLRLAVHPAE